MSEATEVTSEQMLATGMNYRQLDYWVTKGYLRPTEKSPGSGNQRRFPHREYDVAQLMVRLRIVGVELRPAARLARDAIEAGQDRIVLGDGLVISVEAAA